MTSSTAEQTAIALVRACELPTTNLTSSSKAATGVRHGPNDGQAVWLVQVDASVSEPSSRAAYESHFLIEVNQATGAPTVVGIG